MADLVAVHAQRVEHGSLAGKHRVCPAGLGQLDGARHAALRSGGVAAHLPALCHHHRLQPPATAEAGHARLEGRAREVDVPAHFGRVVVGVERRSGPTDAVEIGERHAGRQRLAFGHGEHVRLDAADAARGLRGERGGVVLALPPSAVGDQEILRGCGDPVDDEDVCGQGRDTKHCRSGGKK